METFTAIVVKPYISCGLFYAKLTPTNMVQTPTDLDSLLGVEAQKFSGLWTCIFLFQAQFLHQYSTFSHLHVFYS